MEKTRNYGIDLLRIVAMLMVIILHICGEGGILNAADPSLWRSKAAWLLEIASFCAVNCYAMISGFVGLRSRFNFTRIILLWLRVLFYSLGITALFAVFSPDKVNIDVWKKSLMPVMKFGNWYFTCYFLMYFLTPIFNSAVDNLPRSTLRALLFVIFGAYSGLQTVLGNQALGGGYTVVWLSLLYILGAYFRKYSPLKNVRGWRALLGYAAMVLLTWGSKYAIRSGLLGERFSETMFIYYISPTILLSAIFLLLFFRDLKLPSWCIKAVKVFSPLTFSVFVMHTHFLVWGNLIALRFVPYVKLSSPLLVLATVGTAAAILVGCSAVDLLREGLFRLLKLKERIGRLEERLLPRAEKVLKGKD